MELDFLRDPRYSVCALSDAIMQIPNEYSLLSSLGLFPEKGIRTTYVEVEIKKGVLNLIPVSERGAPSPTKAKSTRQTRVMKTLFHQQNDVIRPSDLQNLPAFGSDMFLDGFEDELSDRFVELQRGYRQTHEFWRWMALQGDVVDADGTTVLYNCYTEMGESQQSIDFKFGTTSEDTVMQATKDARRYMQRNLLGETMNRVLYLCHPTFFDSVTQHPEIQAAYKNTGGLGRPNPAFEDLGVTYFQHGTATFIEHDGFATYVDPTDGSVSEQQFIPDDEAIAVPLGTQQTFRSYYSPGEMMDAVNMPGQSMYASLKELDHGAGIEIHTESSPLFLVQNPRLVLRCYSSN